MFQDPNLEDVLLSPGSVPAPFQTNYLEAGDFLTEPTVDDQSRCDRVTQN